MGTGEIALPTFSWLLASDYQVVGLVTQPDRPVGKSKVPQAPKIKELALAAGLDVWQPESLRQANAEVDQWSRLGIDWIVVMAYGQIIPRSVLALPGGGCVNLHASLLPKYRGASCIQAAIAAGDPVSGLSLMHVVPKLDAGEVILQSRLPLHAKVTGGELHDQLASQGPALLARGLELLASGAAPKVAQIEAEASYAPKLERADGRINWDKPAGEIERMIRAYDPWPGATTQFSDKRGRKRLLKLAGASTVVDLQSEFDSSAEQRSGYSTHWQSGQLVTHHDETVIVCGTRALKPAKVQPEGGRWMKWQDFLHGNPHVSSLLANV